SPLEPVPGAAQPKSKCEKFWTLPNFIRLIWTHALLVQSFVQELPYTPFPASLRPLLARSPVEFDFDWLKCSDSAVIKAQACFRSYDKIVAFRKRYCCRISQPFDHKDPLGSHVAQYEIVLSDDQRLFEQ